MTRPKKAEYLRRVVSQCQSSASVDLCAPEWIEICNAEAELSPLWLEAVQQPYLLILNTVKPQQMIEVIKAIRQLFHLLLSACKIVAENSPATIMVSHSLCEIKDFFNQMLIPGVGLEVYHSSSAKDRRGRFFYPVVQPWPIGLVGVEEDQRILAEALTAIMGPEVLERFANSRHGNQEVLIRMPVTLTQAEAPWASSCFPPRALQTRLPYRFVRSTTRSSISSRAAILP